MVLKETTAYYAQHQSPAFCAFLNATKAFSRILFLELFALVIKQTCQRAWLDYMSIYIFIILCESGGGVCCQEYYSVANGVKHGGGFEPCSFLHLYGWLAAVTHEI